jgi:hypothetical protein
LRIPHAPSFRCFSVEGLNFTIPSENLHSAANISWP